MGFSTSSKSYRFPSLCCFDLPLVVHFWAANGKHPQFSKTIPDWISVTPSAELVLSGLETVVLRRVALARKAAILPRRQHDMLSLEADAQRLHGRGLVVQRGLRLQDQETPKAVNGDFSLRKVPDLLQKLHAQPFDELFAERIPGIEDYCFSTSM